MPAWHESRKNEITIGSQTGMRKGKQYALTWVDTSFRLRLITLSDTKTGVPHTVPTTEDLYTALKDQQGKSKPECRSCVETEDEANEARR